MSNEREAYQRLIILGENQSSEFFLPSKAKEGWYTKKLKEVLKKYDNTNTSPGRYTTQTPKSYRELLDQILKAVSEDNEDNAMLLRAEVMSTFRRNDSQIEAALFRRHTQKQLGYSVRVEPDTVDMFKISGMDLLVDGFIPANDLTMLHGKAGTGKTTAALKLAFAVLDGTGFLDHSHPAKPAPVLFIASDSGAAPLKAVLQDIGAGNHEALTAIGQHRLFVWAAEPSQGTRAWAADLRGCIRLRNFVEAHGVKLVLIDSCKAVCSGAGLDYTDNKLVTALLTYFKEVICPYAAVVWIDHDGVEKGANAGAKAWKEIPSAVHRIIKDDLCEFRTWHAQKMRVGQERCFNYGLKDGQLCLISGEKPVGDCQELIVRALSRAFEQGRGHLLKSELREQICSEGGPSHKTLDNTLSKGVKAKHPEFTRVNNHIGCYRLAGRLQEALKAQMVCGKEQQQNPVSEVKVTTSRQVPTGTHEDDGDVPREEVGNTAEASDCNTSGGEDSHEVYKGITNNTDPAPKCGVTGGMADHIGNGRNQLRLVD